MGDPRVDVNVNVNMNGQSAGASRPRSRPRKRRSSPEYGRFDEFYSKDGWSWMGVTSELALPDRNFRISFEMQVKRELWSNWIYDQYGMRQLQFEGWVRDNQGERIDIRETVHLPEGHHFAAFDYWPEHGFSWIVEMSMRVKKSGGYWQNEGPDSHVCEGTIIGSV